MLSSSIKLLLLLCLKHLTIVDNFIFRSVFMLTSPCHLTHLFLVIHLGFCFVHCSSFNTNQSNSCGRNKRHYILRVKALTFPGVMYKCECWTTKEAECRRIDAFELWCWRRLLRVSWTARKSNQSIPREINLEYSLKD